MTIEQLKEEIDANITTNGNREITGSKLNGVLNDTADMIGNLADPFIVIAITGGYVTSEDFEKMQSSDKNLVAVSYYSNYFGDVFARFAIADDARIIGGNRVHLSVFTTQTFVFHQDEHTPTCMFYNIGIDLEESETNPGHHKVYVEQVTINDITTEIV